MLRTRRLLGAYAVRSAVTSQAELSNTTRDQQTRIRRTMGRVASNASFSLQWSMLVNKRTLLIDVTLKASSIGADREPRLL